MSEVMHTPGVWTYRKELPSGPHDNRAEIFAHGDVIGVAYRDSRADNAQQNARLMSAAPDLLNALRAVVRVADRATDEFKLAHAAIAKATQS